ncbi:MAG: hypothetical protein RL385_1388 [Pseudomonadota bacterium]
MPLLDTFDCLSAKDWVYLTGEESTDTWAEDAGRAGGEMRRNE